MTRLRSGRALALALALAALAGCADEKVGTIAIGLTTAPGSALMDRVVQLRLTLTNPRQELVADRTERGFDLALELPADGEVGSLLVDGLDGSGALVATGASPPLPLAAIDARVVVYMAEPMSVGAAPVALAPARSRPSVAALGYGAVLAGGVDAMGAPSDAIQIYNAYDHSLSTGLPMPGPREGAIVAVGANNGVFLFGGTGPGGAPTGTLWFFDTTVAPSGRYTALDEFPQFARAGRAAVPFGSSNTFLVTGAPTIVLTASRIAERSDIPALSSAATVVARDGILTAVAVEDATGDLLRVRPSPEPLGAQRKNGLAVALPDHRVAVLGGDAGPRDAAVVDTGTGELTPAPGALAEAYASLAAASTPRFLVVAGGRAGGASTQVEVLDAATLERRHAASVDDAITAAVALPNQQVLLIGAALHLFTPPPPE